MRIKPMLAYKFDKNRVDFNQIPYIQPKLDGVRCIFTKDGAYSRANNKFMNVAHLEKKLANFFKENPDKILDGELYNHRLKNDFEKIISLVKKQKVTKKDMDSAKALVEYHIYDIIPLKPSHNDLYQVRYDYIEKVFDNTPFTKGPIKWVKAFPVSSYEEAMDFHTAFMNKGYEGSILRKNGLYKQKRAWELQKFKDFSDSEATIIGYEIGKGKRKGTIGKFIMQDDDGIEFGCPPGKGYTYKDMQKMLENIDDYIGERATFTYFQKTQAGSYRHPLFKGLRNYE
tara:strand:+ start:634 stop:1488 length:855 start_codon:yes stop_codon:yes gene_type:complete